MHRTTTPAHTPTLVCCLFQMQVKYFKGIFQDPTLFFALPFQNAVAREVSRHLSLTAAGGALVMGAEGNTTSATAAALAAGSSSGSSGSDAAAALAAVAAAGRAAAAAAAEDPAAEAISKPSSPGSSSNGSSNSSNGSSPLGGVRGLRAVLQEQQQQQQSSSLSSAALLRPEFQWEPAMVRFPHPSLGGTSMLSQVLALFVFASLMFGCVSQVCYFACYCMFYCICYYPYKAAFRVFHY